MEKSQEATLLDTRTLEIHYSILKFLASAIHLISVLVIISVRGLFLSALVLLYLTVSVSDSVHTNSELRFLVSMWCLCPV